MIEVIGDGVIVDDIGANSILGKRNKREREREKQQNIIQVLLLIVY